jgi:hypothetical protein
MAITVTTPPQSVQPAHNEIDFVISSTSTAQPNFYFVADINVSGQTNPVARLIFPKQPSVTTLTLNVASVLKNYLSFDFTNIIGLATIVAPNTNSRAKYYVEFRELYDIASVPTLSAVLATSPASGTNQATNAIFDFEDWTNSILASYNINNGIWLNQSSFSNYIQAQQEIVLTYYDPSDAVAYVKLTTYNSAGAQISTATDSIFNTADDYIYNMPSGAALFTHLGITWTNVDSYKIALLNSSSAVIATKTIYIDSDCSFYDTFRLHWLNKLGGWDSYNFRKLSRQNEDIERKQFKKFQNLNYNKYDRLKTNYYTKITDKITLNSDWITDLQAEVFEELITSPAIYLERGVSTFVAVNVIDSSYEQKKAVNERKLFNLTLDIEYSYERYRQAL